MPYTLTRRVAGVDYYAVSALGDIQLVRYFRGGVQQMSKQSLVEF
jgi:hypothetical protein